METTKAWYGDTIGSEMFWISMIFDPGNNSPWCGGMEMRMVG